MNINMQFPKDHYNHPEFKTEWWYFAGIGELEDYGKTNYHISFFRKYSSKLKKTISFAHFGLNKNGRFEFKQKRSDDFSFSDSSFEVRIGDWKLNGWNKRFITLLNGGTSLVHVPQKQPVINRGGYYSITDLNVNGSIDGNVFHGMGWFDHEFHNLSTLEILSNSYKWFALQLNNNIEIMIYLYPRFPAKAIGTMIFPKGEIQNILPGDYCLTEHKDDWQLKLPNYGMEFDLLKETEGKITNGLGPDYIEGTFNIYNRNKIGQGFFEITEGI